MLKKASIAIGLVALLLFSLVVFFSSSALQECQSRQSETYAEQAKANPPILSFASANQIVITARCVGHVVNDYRDAVTAFATCFIALFTLTLWLSTRAIMSATKATKETVNLTRETVILTREEFISTHRPRLRVRQFILDTPTPENPLIVHFAIINTGETRANWRDMAAEVALWNGRFWEAPGINQIVQPVTNPPLRSGQRVRITIQSRFNVTAAQIGAIERGELIICAVGELAYADDLGVTRRTGFRRNYDIGSDMFTATSNQDQEYED